MMQVWWCGFLLLTHFLCHVHPLECDTKYKYEWPSNNPNRCCKKCEPGHRMVNRCSISQETDCKPCGSDFYWENYSTEMECKRCSQCTKEHMEYKVNCTKIRDAVCACKSGYKCTGNPCTGCVEIPTTTPPTTTTPPPTTAPPPATISITKVSTKNDDPKTPPLQDTVWITLSLCCVCILLTCFILISRHTPPCGWIMLASAGSFWGSKKHSAESSQCTEDEEVPMPVQEVCGKEWQEEV